MEPQELLLSLMVSRAMATLPEPVCEHCTMVRAPIKFILMLVSNGTRYAMHSSDSVCKHCTNYAYLTAVVMLVSTGARHATHSPETAVTASQG